MSNRASYGDGTGLDKSVTRLVDLPAPAAAPPVEQVAGIPPQRGVGAQGAAKPASSASGGIAGPLVEKDATRRLYYDSVVLTSTDGLLTIAIRPIKRVIFADPANRELIVDFAAPPP